jgi:polysaccharide deacetylase family protein (PEP-CTERM system associated)
LGRQPDCYFPGEGRNGEKATYEAMHPPSDITISNALTIDVEDYFHVTAFEKHINPEDWNNFPLRVVDNTMKILDLLDTYSTMATFFVLGWVAERCPSLVREIHKRGHEIACHGYGHRLVYRTGIENFRIDIRRARSILEDICGERVNGYRAPSYSITKDSLWALDVLIEEGFTYDSSIFPILHDLYGVPDAHRFPHEIVRQSGRIREFPMTTMEIGVSDMRYRIPVAGGGYLRLFPLCFMKRAIHCVNDDEGQPVVFYFHPWEIDPGQPRIRAGLRSRFRHYLNLKKTFDKVSDILCSFRFAPMKVVLDAVCV